MKAIWIVPVIVSILILGVIGYGSIVFGDDDDDDDDGGAISSIHTHIVPETIVISHPIVGFTATASCATGDLVTGGGWNEGESIVDVVNSFPVTSDPQGWFVEGDTVFPFTNENFVVFAICLHISS